MHEKVKKVFFLSNSLIFSRIWKLSELSKYKLVKFFTRLRKWLKILFDF